MPPQDALERSNFYQRLCDIAQEGLWVYDHQDRVSIVNRSLAKMLGYSTVEMIGRDIHDFYAEGQFDTLRAALARRRQGVTESYEVELRGKDGVPVPAIVSATPIYDADGQYAGAAAMVLNMTMQRRAEEEAHRDKERFEVMSRATKDVLTAAAAGAAETQNRLQALFDNALDTILLMNDDGFFIDANPSGSGLLGYSHEEIIRLHFTALTPPPSDDEAKRHWFDFQRTGRRVSEFTVRRKDGGMVDIEYCAVRDIQPGVHLVVVRDITERKQFEQNLAENQLRLEALASRIVQAQEDERMRIARELHDEIGQTLTAVTLGIDAIGRIAGNSRVAPLVEEMRVAIDRAVERVHEISLGLRPLMLDDLGLVATLRWYLDGQAQKAGLQIQFNPETTADRFARDVETACFRIVQEAVTNVVRHARAGRIWVDLTVQVDQLLLTVKDNGCGFDAAKQMAQRFSLGLAGMAERARLLGGTIDILAQPGHGTTIRVIFPRRIEEKHA